MGVTIGLIGDSTVAKQSGWGPAFASRFNGEAQILNYAKNGGFLESMSKWLEKLIENEPDYVLIQFGHNDQKRYDTKAYSQKLRSYIKRIQEAGGKPIILSSVVRRSFDKNGKIVSRKHDAYKANLTAYADAAMAVAKDMNLPFIDLHRISEAHHNEIGRKESMTYNFKEGDRTHFNKKGGQAITDLILPELKKVAPELTTWLVVNKDPKEHKAFEKALNGDWETVLSDSCTEDWKKKWFLDGEVGQVTTGPDGMALTAGPEFKNDAHHMVLWTKDVFEGDVKIEYDYTRLDEATNCVNILYIQATGSGEEPYVRDITKWNELRKIPAMKTYFNHMHTYHISYAVGEPSNGYIRARRYMPNATGLKGSDLKPDYFPKGMFATGVPHKIAVIKKDRDIFMRIENDEQTYYCHMTNPDLPIVTEGRIGLRHMFTRSARYKNFKISTPSK